MDEKCPACGSTHIAKLYDQGEIVCMDCGTVIGTITYNEPLRDENGMTLTGPPKTIMQSQITSQIIIKGKDATGKRLSAKQKLQALIMQKYHRGTTPFERAMKQAEAEINIAGAKLSIPKHIIQEALQIFAQARKARITKGFSVPVVARASLYLACRKNKHPILLSDLTQDKTKQQRIAYFYRRLLSTNNMKIKPTNPIDYLDKIITTLNLDIQTKEIAKGILEEFLKHANISGKNPTGYATAAVYIACKITKKPISQRTIAKTVNIQEVTLRNRLFEIAKTIPLPIKIRPTNQNHTHEPIIFAKYVIRKHIKLALEYLNDGKTLVDKDPVQASEKLYKAAEESIKALALHLNLKNQGNNTKRGKWSKTELTNAVKHISEKHGIQFLQAWADAQTLHNMSFHKTNIDHKTVKLKLQNIENIVSETQNILKTTIVSEYFSHKQA
jgi:transcription initiation factor TFIIB